MGYDFSTINLEYESFFLHGRINSSMWIYKTLKKIDNDSSKGVSTLTKVTNVTNS
jgi:hypothetical protein